MSALEILFKLHTAHNVILKCTGRVQSEKDQDHRGVILYSDEEGKAPRQGQDNSSKMALSVLSE